MIESDPDAGGCSSLNNPDCSKHDQGVDIVVVTSFPCVASLHVDDAQESWTEDSLITQHFAW